MASDPSIPTSKPSASADAEIATVVLADTPVAPQEPPPEPGFGMAFPWCFVFLIVPQVIPVVIILLALVAAQAIRTHDWLSGLRELTAKDGMDRITAPAMFVAEIFVIAFSLLAI